MYRCFLNTRKQTAFVERLVEKITCTLLDGRHRHLNVSVSGSQDDRSVIMNLVKTIHQFQTGQAGHPNVAYHAIELRRPIDCGQKVFRYVEARHREIMTDKVKP